MRSFGGSVLRHRSCAGVGRFATTTRQALTTAPDDEKRTPKKRKVALVMGVANQRSIAWSCVQTFLDQGHHVIITHQDRFQEKVQSLVQSVADPDSASSARILGHLSCDVQTDLPILFSEQIPRLLETAQQQQQEQDAEFSALDAIVHCIAYGNVQMSLRHVDWETYREAQHISAYSLLETAQCAQRANLLAPARRRDGSAGEAVCSLTALSYLGAVRALYPYHVMGPAKAALEALVRGMALEFGPAAAAASTTDFLVPLRVNCVSAGPIATLSSRGGIADFATLQQATSQSSPLGRPVTAREVAETVAWVANSATAMTGQTVYVDGGFSSVVPILSPSESKP